MSETQIVDMLIAGHKNVEWFNTHFLDILKKYDNQYIAIHDQSIADADSNLEYLMEKLDKEGIDNSNVLIKFISKVQAIL